MAEEHDEIIKSKIIFCLGGKAAEALTNGYGKDYIFKLLKKQKKSSDLKNAIYFSRQIDSDHAEDLLGLVQTIPTIINTNSLRQKSEYLNHKVECFSEAFNILKMQKLKHLELVNELLIHKIILFL